MPFATHFPKQSFIFRVASAVKSIRAGTAIALLAALSLSACESETVIVSTLAGGEQGFADGQGNTAQFYQPSGIAIDAVGNLYVVELGQDYRIRKITPEGKVSTHADGEEGLAYERRSSAFSWLYGIATDTAGNIYRADFESHRIIKVTPEGKGSFLAGGEGEEGFADGQGSSARFRYPRDIAIDAAGNLYVADTDNHSIRKVTPEGKVSTLAGNGEEGFADGQGSAARFDHPCSIAIDAVGNLYVTDYGNNRIRKIEIRRP